MARRGAVGDAGADGAGRQATLTGPGGERVSGLCAALRPASTRRRATGWSMSICPPTPRSRPACSREANSNSAGAPALTVPQSAVVPREGFSHVFRLEAGDRVAQAKVQLGRRAGERRNPRRAGRRGAHRRFRRRFPGRRRCRQGRRPASAGRCRPHAMNVSAWSIRNPIPAILLFVLLTLAGVVSFRAMKVQQFMDIELPTVTVTASLPGAAPAQMETEVARKIENSVATLQGIKHIYTKVQDGTATITIEFRLEKADAGGGG